MNGYSKISSTPTTTSQKSRSIDFSDIFSFSQTPKPIRNTTVVPPTTVEAVNDNEVIKKREVDEGERFGVILGRSSSVSSSSCSASGFQATMERAFSIRSSSSVSERYCRIHDQNMVTTSSDDDATKKKKQRGGKILKVCKRFFGF
ncbi:uncharacterized protein LOC127086026 [Lathyrus oleraceus]|nr:uncharacterized protein LOC127086026 [Pisum sativum]